MSKLLHSTITSDAMFCRGGGGGGGGGGGIVHAAELQGAAIGGRFKRQGTLFGQMNTGSD